MQIIKKRSGETVYVSEDGRKELLSEVHPVHLLNALLKSRNDITISTATKKRTVPTALKCFNELRSETLRRIYVASTK